MFVRVIHDTSRQRPRWRVIVVESRRLGTTVLQKVIQEIGTAYDLEASEQLRAEGELFILSRQQQQLAGTRPLFDAPTLAQVRAYLRQPSERSRQSPGALSDLYLSNEAISVGDLVWGELYREIGWDQVLGVRKRSANQILKQLVLARLARPRSKRRTAQEQSASVGPRFSVNRAYQTMDYLDEARQQKVVRDWRRRALSLHQKPLTAVLYDTTTLAFESAREDLGELRRKGYSKDGKPQDVQVLFALLITPTGLPLGYRIYPGNQYEGHTLLDALAGFQEEGMPRQMTVIADAGLCHYQNQQLLQQHGYHYVLGQGVRNLKQQWQAALFDLDRYTEVTLPEGPTLKLRVLLDGDRRVLVTYSEKRARKDAKQREKTIEKLRQRLGTRAPVKECIRPAMSKFLHVSPQGYVTLDDAAIAADARWDGLHAIVTNHDNPQDDVALLAQYRQLGQIEDGFRTNKHQLQVRPVYHWKDRRIQAHFLICFMAFCCLQELRWRLRTRKVPFSVDQILTLLQQTQLPLMENVKTNKQYVLAAAAPKELKTLMRIFNLQWPRYSFELPEPVPKPAMHGG